MGPEKVLWTMTALWLTRLKSPRRASPIALMKLTPPREAPVIRPRSDAAFEDQATLRLDHKSMCAATWEGSLALSCIFSFLLANAWTHTSVYLLSFWHKAADDVAPICPSP